MAYQTKVIAAVSWLQPPNLHLRPSHTCLARVRLPWLSCIYNICANIDDYIQLREEKMRGRPFLPFFPSPFSSFFSFLPPFSPLSGESKSLPPAWSKSPWRHQQRGGPGGIPPGIHTTTGTSKSRAKQFSLLWWPTAAPIAARKEALGASLKVCKSCMFVRYCNADCQRNHWPTHKKECKIQAAKLHRN